MYKYAYFDFCCSKCVFFVAAKEGQELATDVAVMNMDKADDNNILLS